MRTMQNIQHEYLNILRIKRNELLKFPKVSAGSKTTRYGQTINRRKSIVANRKTREPTVAGRLSLYRQARFEYALEIGQKTMNQCRIVCGKARIIVKDGIKARDIFMPT